MYQTAALVMKETIEYFQSGGLKKAGVAAAAEEPTVEDASGADVVFVDGIRTANDLKEYKRRLGNLPILFNNVPLLPLGVVNELGGAAIVIHPGPWMCSGKVFDEELRRLKKDGVVSLENPFDYFIKAVEVLGAEKYFKLDNHYKNLCQ